MPKTLKNFADSERAREYRNRQRERNYALCPGDDDVRHTRWQDWERRLVMEHEMPDREISRMTGRSVRAIQVMRHKMRKADCAHWLGKNLGCKYPDLDGCRISPSNCPEYISREDYQEQEEFYE